MAHAGEIVEQSIRRDILSGKLHGGQAIASEAMLMRRFSIGRNSVRAAIETLAAEGLVVKRRGARTRVVSPEERCLPVSPRPVRERQVVFLHFLNTYTRETMEEYGTAEPTLNGFMRTLEARGCNFLYYHLSDEADAPSCLKNDDVGGVLFLGCPTERVRPYLKRLPCVGIHYHHPAMDCGFVSLDNESRSFVAVEHLVRLGHRRIAYYYSSRLMERDQVSRDRYEGWRKAMLHFGLVPDDSLLVYEPHEYLFPLAVKGEPIPDMESVLADLMARADRPTALINLGFATTYGLIAAGEKAGLTLPRDLSLVSGCNMPALAYGYTAVCDRVEDICARAAELLTDSMADCSPIPGQRIQLRASLLPGNSTCPTCIQFLQMSQKQRGVGL